MRCCVGIFSFLFQNAKSEFFDQHNLFARVEGCDEVFTSCRAFLMFSPPVYLFGVYTVPSVEQSDSGWRIRGESCL